MAVDQPSNVGAAHQPCARKRCAAASAASVPSKSPKQVAPEPVMRASRQPDDPASWSSTAPTAGTSVTAAGWRSLRQAASQARTSSWRGGIALEPRLPRRQCQPAENLGCGDRHAGIDQQRRQPRHTGHGLDSLANACHAAGFAIEADRHVGTKRHREGTEVDRLLRDAESARRPRIAAAASAEPPPMPDATGRFLSS